MMVRAPACNLDPLSWLLEGLHQNSSGLCSALSGPGAPQLLACLRGQVWGAAPSAKALSVGRGFLGSREAQPLHLPVPIHTQGRAP